MAFLRRKEIFRTFVGCASADAIGMLGQVSCACDVRCISSSRMEGGGTPVLPFVFMLVALLRPCR